MTLLERDTHSSSASAPPVHQSDTLKWLQRHWPLATITAAVFIMLVWMGALMCFALMFARRI
jgi:hypothetical protein